MRKRSGIGRNYTQALKLLRVNWKHEKCSKMPTITYNVFSAVNADREGIVPVSELPLNILNERNKWHM